MQHKLELDDGRLFVELPEGRFLVSTGSPGSFDKVASETVAGALVRDIALAIQERVGLLPPLGKTLLSLVGVRAIIGCSWMGNHRIGIERDGTSVWFQKSSA